MPFTNVKRCKQIANSLLLFMSSTVEKTTVFGKEVHRTIFCLCSPRSPDFATETMPAGSCCKVLPRSFNALVLSAYLCRPLQVQPRPAAQTLEDERSTANAGSPPATIPGLRRLVIPSTIPPGTTGSRDAALRRATPLAG